MQITRRKLDSYIRAEQRVVGIETTLHVITAYYCGPMKVHGLCTAECSDCFHRIVSIFEGIPEARVPKALMIWRSKEVFAKYREEFFQHEGKPDIHLTPEGNIFENMLERL